MSIGTGTRLGQYEVHDFIGQGAMNLVYRAHHALLERTGAVKVLHSMPPDPDTAARFRHEAQAIAQMRHPNILNVYDFGEFQGSPYMIVQYVPGGNLADRLSQGRLDQSKALLYLRGISAGLDYAHGLGVVHRDVTPANVLLEKDDTPVLADFGLANLLQRSSSKSISGVTTGTPAYMAPEQVVGSRVGPAADQYSLATIAYEILTGVIPFDGEGLMELLYAQVHREPMPPSARNSSLSAEVDAVIMRGLAKDAARRWETCTALVDALAAALATKAEPAVARTMAMEQTVASTKLLAAPTQPLAKPRFRRGIMALAAVAAPLVLLIVGTTGYFATHQGLSLSVSPSTVVAGDTVVVKASHVPANQAGEIRLFSTMRAFAFQANAGGTVSVPVKVPSDIGAGDHAVSICWAAVCRASASLRVIQPAASVTPTAGATPSATASATARPTPTAVPQHRPSR